MVHMGRYTAALLLIATGAALVLDQMSGTQYMRTLVEWWPVILIVLGVEVILLSLIYRNRADKLHFSFGSVFGAAAIAFVVMLMTGFGSGNMDSLNWRFWEQAWNRVERPVEYVQPGTQTELIRVKNRNGKVLLQSGDTDQVELQSTIVYSGLLSQHEARAVEEESRLEIRDDGRTLEIEAVGKRYRRFFWTTEARMDVVITVPQDRLFDYELELANGDIDIRSLELLERMSVRTSNGDIDIYDIAGDVRAVTKNGNIHIGRMYSQVEAETSNGDVWITDVRGPAEVRTKNGDVEARDIYSSFIAETSNGDIIVSSPIVGGNWKFLSKNGDLELEVPETGDYRIRGRGDIKTSIPWLNKKRKSVEGEIGSGLHVIEAETKNGDLEIDLIQK